SSNSRRLHSFPTRRSSDLIGAAGMIVADDLTAVGNTHAGEPGDERVRVRQWMAAILAGKRPRKIPVHMRETGARDVRFGVRLRRSEEHTSELQSLRHLVCR